MYQKYKDRVQFVLVYIREAHPDSILFVQTEAGSKTLGVVSQTQSAVDRLKNLQQCTLLLQLTMPSVIDDDDNSMNRTYAAWPDRLYAIGVDGKVAFKSGPGPSGFKSPDLAAWLQKNVK
jgi:hypothetical protein